MLYFCSTDDHQWKISGFRRGEGQVRSSRFIMLPSNPEERGTSKYHSTMKWYVKKRGRICLVQEKSPLCTQWKALCAVRHSTDASGHHHAPIALLSLRLESPSPRKEPLIPIEKETEWAPEPVWALKKEKISCLCREWTTGSSRPWSCHYTLLQNREYELCVISTVVGVPCTTE